MKSVYYEIDENGNKIQKTYPALMIITDTLPDLLVVIGTRQNERVKDKIFKKWQENPTEGIYETNKWGIKWDHTGALYWPSKPTGKIDLRGIGKENFFAKDIESPDEHLYDTIE